MFNSDKIFGYQFLSLVKFGIKRPTSLYLSQTPILTNLDSLQSLLKSSEILRIRPCFDIEIIPDVVDPSFSTNIGDNMKCTEASLIVFSGTNRTIVSSKRKININFFTQFSRVNRLFSH